MISLEKENVPQLKTKLKRYQEETQKLKDKITDVSITQTYHLDLV